MKRKRKLLFIVILFTLLLIGSSIWFIIYNQKVEVILKKNLKVSYEENITNLSFVEKVKNGKLITKETLLNTSNLGKQEVNILLQNKFGKKKNYTFEIEVVDTVSPNISYNTSILITEGEEVNLLKDVVAVDNIDGEVEVSIIGEYDTNKIGTYNLEYVAKDKSGNESKVEFQLVVKQKTYTNQSGSSIPDNTFKTSKGFLGCTKDGITYIDGILIANKTYSLPSNYGSGLTIETQNAFNQMKNAARSDGITIEIISGFRSYSRQSNIYNNYVAHDGKENADRYSARAGHSEHQTGLAMDINSLNVAFENTKEGKWLKNNSYKYGFILRYTKEGENITGYMYEPWHYRYVGVELATKLYNNGNWIPLEEYFGITSKYQ